MMKRMAFPIFAAGLAAALLAGQQTTPPATDVFVAPLSMADGQLTIGQPRNLTGRDGYDNQPAFSPDGRAIFYTSLRDRQTDIYRYDLDRGAAGRVTDTPEGEYSPTVMPAGRRLSVVRVEADSVQRLWSLALDGSDPQLVLPDVKPVGYHAWLDERTLVLFMLGTPPTLQLADVSTGRATVIAGGIGRSLHKVPGRRAASFVHKVADGEWWIKELDPDTREARPIVRTRPGREDYAWTPAGSILMADGSRLYEWRPGPEAAWREVIDLAPAGLTEITRLAVSPAGDRLALVAVPAGRRAPADREPVFDLIVSGGTVVDGSGAPGRSVDVGIRNGRIAAVGRLPRERAREVLDATGLVVAPGFIDVHTHADSLADHPAAGNFVRMGVTSIVAGNCGSSAVDVAEALERIARTGVSVNFATLIGHNSVRREVMGTSQRPPSASELAKLKALVWRAMTDGAVGLSTGLEYIPGAYASSMEITELARVAAQEGGLYASHMRNEGTELEKAVAETIAVGRRVGGRVQISHLKVDSPSRWGASAAALALIDEARREGLAVQADQYAYTAASSGLAIRFPAWALEGGQDGVAARLHDAETWARIKDEIVELLAARGLRDLSFAVVASYEPDPSLNGLSMREVAVRLRGSASADAQLEAAREMMLGGGASMVYHFMSEQDVERIMRHPWVGFASDAGVLQFGAGMPHPRGYGNAARVLGVYVRTRQVLQIEEAIRKMTSLPATHFRFADRGLVREGYAADLVLFDPARVSDPSDFGAPHRFAEGIPHVLVNGVAVVRDGEHTGARPGQLLRIQPAPGEGGSRSAPSGGAKPDRR
jgi:N-acyl-D-amino-acid deacylase